MCVHIHIDTCLYITQEDRHIRLFDAETSVPVLTRALLFWPNCTMLHTFTMLKHICWMFAELYSWVEHIRLWDRTKRKLDKLKGHWWIVAEFYTWMVHIRLWTKAVRDWLIGTHTFLFGRALHSSGAHQPLNNRCKAWQVATQSCFVSRALHMSGAHQA